jgi:hypothetical protein
MGEEVALPARLMLVCDTTLKATARLWTADDLAELLYLGVPWERGLFAPAADAPPSAGGRMAAARQLEQLGRLDDALLAYLTLACDAALDDEVRLQAADALGQLSRAAHFPAGRDVTVPILRALARSAVSEAYDRMLAARSLAKLGCVSEAAPILLALAQGPDVEDDVRLWAVDALGELGGATPEVLAGLRALEEDGAASEHVRQATRKAIRLLHSALEE